MGETIKIAPATVDLLWVLPSEQPKAISMNDRQERLWPATFVVEKNLANLVSELVIPSVTIRAIRDST